MLDLRARRALAPRTNPLLVADLHVHPYPGDGSLTIWQLQREAARRGVDVIAITSHNHRAGIVVSNVLGTDPDGAIVLPGQEVTSAGFHMIAAGIEELIDWRLPAVEAVTAVQRQGGVAVAAHPVSLINAGWDTGARRLLDGAEVMHPLRFGYEQGARELDLFFRETLEGNPSLAAIGATDFHMLAPLGLCRTYILARERTAAAAIAAIREGRTAAGCADGALVGAPDQVAAVRSALASMPLPQPPSAFEKVLAVAALAALALLALPRRR
jgi:hypothetical protein